MKNLKGLYGMALAMSMMSTVNYGIENEPREFIPQPKKDVEPRPKNGQFYYWFRNDGTFLSEKQGERMLKTEVFFTCFAINDKTAIKKFNKFLKTI